MDEAIETLASPDVTVTNQSDKELQLYKLRELDSLVQEAVAQCAREALSTPPWSRSRHPAAAESVAKPRGSRRQAP